MGSITIFEKQKQNFNDFIESFQDRCDLLIRDGVNIIFDETCITFDELITMRYSIKKLYPEIIFLGVIDTPDKVKFASNIYNNIDELISLMKEYIILYNHLKSFIDKGESTNTLYNAIVDGIKDVEANNPSALEQKYFFIESSAYNGSPVSCFLRIDSYGCSKKICADISYVIVNKESLEESVIYNYKIQKDKLASDVAFQVANSKMSHIE